MRDSGQPCQPSGRGGWAASSTAARVALGLVMMAGAALVWSVPWLPMGDLGGHVEVMEVMARHDDPEALFGAYFRLPRRVGPNTLTLGFAWLVAPALDAWQAARLLVAWYAIGLPLGLWLVARAFGRSEWLAVAAGPLAFGALFNVGLLNYLIAIPFLLMATALARRYGTQGGAWRGGALVGALGLAFFGHVIAYLIAAGICAFLIALFAPDWRRALARQWPLLPGAPLLGAWLYFKVVEAEETVTGRAFVGDEGLGAVWRSARDLSMRLHTWGMQFFRDGSDEVAFAVLGVGWTLVVIAAWRGARADARDDADADADAERGVAAPRLGSGDRGAGGAVGRWSTARVAARRHALAIIALGCGVGYFAVPSQLHEAQLVGERVWSLALLFGALAAPVRGGSRLARTGVALMVGVALLYPLNVWWQFRRYDAQVLGAMPAAIMALEPRTRLCFLMIEPDSEVVYMGPFWHLPKGLHAVYNGGVSEDSFASVPHHAVQYRQPPPPRLGATGFWLQPALDAYDHVLIHARQVAPAALRSPRLRLRFHEGQWWLFDVVERPPVHGRPVLRR